MNQTITSTPTAQIIRHQSVVRKAQQLLAFEKVEIVAHGMYRVTGDTGIRTVVIHADGRAFCDCDWAQYHHTLECSHTIAARMKHGQMVVAYNGEIPGIHPIFTVAETEAEIGWMSMSELLAATIAAPAMVVYNWQVIDAAKEAKVFTLVNGDNRVVFTITETRAVIEYTGAYRQTVRTSIEAARRRYSYLLRDGYVSEE